MRASWLVLTFGLVLAACSPPGGSSSKETNEGGNGSKTAVKVDVAKVDKPTGALEAAVFEGGFKLDFYTKAGDDLAQSNPDLKPKVWGNPRVWEQLRNRFLANDPPDVTWPGWGMDYWALVYGGQIADLSAALDMPAYNSTTKWRDTFDPNILALGSYEGGNYLIPHHVNINGWWYSPKLFQDNGWTPPTTFDDLLTICEKMKAKGIAPITFQGKYSYYMTSGFIFPWVISAGGIKALDDAFNLEPGAWKSPAMLKAAQMVETLRKQGDFQEGAMGLSHTESQTDFLNRKAGFIPCGTWLHSEMAEVMPPGADMAFMRVPGLTGGQDPTAIQVGIEPWIIPAKAKSIENGIAYLRYITSVEKSKEFVQSKGTLTAIKGSDDVDLPPYLVDAAKALRESKTVWTSDYRLWYPTLGKATEDAMSALLSGDITPEQFCERCEEAAKIVRDDKSIPKHKVQR